MYATTIDDWIEDLASLHGCGQAEEPRVDSLARLATALRGLGIDQVVRQPVGVLTATSDGRTMRVTCSGPSFVTGCWQVVGPVSRPELAAGRVAAVLVAER